MTDVETLTRFLTYIFKSTDILKVKVTARVQGGTRWVKSHTEIERELLKRGQNAILFRIHNQMFSTTVAF